MTVEMGRQITILRLKGLGYRTIADIIGSTRDNVRYYCKTHGLDGDADLVKLNFIEHKNNPKVCKHCGKKIERKPRSGKKLFCSDECRRAWWKEHPEESQRSKDAMYECECAYCKKKFTSYGNKNRKYCSHNCYILHRFWTDPDSSPGAVKVKNRQGMEVSPPGKMTVKRIS
ncbi:MAG: RNA polymerase subunit sigma-70 [Lachnospiraceae bacterium]|nr:RNA polymerase subunit sigma-70 [Lachnospiraceae bacterium]